MINSIIDFFTFICVFYYGASFSVLIVLSKSLSSHYAFQKNKIWA